MVRNRIIRCGIGVVVEGGAKFAQTAIGAREAVTSQAHQHQREDQRRRQDPPRLDQPVINQDISNEASLARHVITLTQPQISPQAISPRKTCTENYLFLFRIRT